jgi:uncharacterized protein
VLGAPAAADFTDGLAAYDAGDYQTSFEEWRPLAEAGDAEAQVALAGLYLAGEGVSVDIAAGISWYRRAAESGDPVAQLNLGDFYSRGAGVPRDLVAAYVWLGLAADQGRVWAEQRRQVIAREMTPEQVSEAQVRLKRKLEKRSE